MYEKELGGGAWLLYNLSGNDWLWNERSMWLDVQKRIGVDI